MSVLENETIYTLLEEVKAYLGITWFDDATDTMLISFIRTSAKRLESIYGNDLTFTLGKTEENEKQNMLAHDLLLARVFYQREKALDDFDKNYRSELLALRNYGKISQMKKSQEEENATE